MIVYLSIGNSDDKLTQEEWCRYINAVETTVVPHAVEVHGRWYSQPVSAYQNACWCLEFIGTLKYKSARAAAIVVRKRFRQDSVAWAVAETEFI